MPYIPSEDRPALDKKIEELAEEITLELIEKNKTVEISEIYHEKFDKIAETIREIEFYRHRIKPKSKSEELAYEIIDNSAKKYNYKGAWLGWLNYSITKLILRVPFKMAEKGKWDETFRYWLYTETVGALTRTANNIDQRNRTSNDWVTNGLAGVFEDIKDEYKRRVNIPYEAEQIKKNGDCYDDSQYRTQLIPFEKDNIKGNIEIMLEKQDLNFKKRD